MAVVTSEAQSVKASAMAVMAGGRQAASPADLGDQPRRILLIEDNFDDALLIKELLHAARLQLYEVEHVAKFSLALATMADRAFDVLLVDLNLPDSPREKTVAAIEALARRYPVVVLTGFNDKDTAIRVSHNGAEAFLHKSDLGEESLSSSIEAAIERHERRRQLEEMIYRDDATGLYNHRGLYQFGNVMTALADITYHELMVIFFDIDGLGAINRRCGRAVGTQVLQAFAEILRRVFRSTDLLCRWGGDEFVALLYNAKLESEKQIADRIEGELRMFNGDCGRDYYLAASYGFSRYDSLQNNTLEKMIKAADSAMRSHKQGKKQKQELEIDS